MSEEQGSINRLRTTLSFIRDLIATIAGLLAIFGLSGVAAFFAFLLHYPMSALLLIAFGIIVFIILILQVRSYLRVRAAPSKWLLRGYMLLRVEYLYRIHDKERIRHSQTIKILLKAIQYGVELLEVRYGWTGRGHEDPPEVRTDGHQLLGYIKPETSGLWKYYYIHFGRELSTNEQVTTEIVQTLQDTEHQFQPFLAKTITEPLDKLVLRVRMPAELRPINISYSERASGDPNSAVLDRKKGAYETIGQEVEIRWEPPKIVRGHRYAIEWSYAHPTL